MDSTKRRVLDGFSFWAVTAALLAMLVASCASDTTKPVPTATEPIPSHAAIGTWGFDPAGLSKTVKPGYDFYRYANEGWLATAKIPTGFPSYDSFVEAHLETEKQLDDLITELTAHPHPIGSIEQQLSALFESYTDVTRLNTLGLKPIQPGLDAIMALKTRNDVARSMARPFTISIVDFGVVLDQKDPTRYVVALDQSGMGLPSREYYLDPGEPYASHRIAYRDYIAATLEHAGLADAHERADRILALETRIAEAHWKPEEMRDPIRMYHAMSPAELAAYAPGFEWKVFLEEGGIADQTKLVVETDSALQKLAALFGETPVEDLKSYLAFHYVDGWSGLLSEDLQKASFDFYGRRLQGIEARRPLRPRAIQFVSGEFGEGLGRAYVQRYFPAAYRAQLDRMIGFMRTAFRDRLENLEWMDEPTRVEALAKLDRIASQVGYPDRWIDYSWVRFDATDLVGNVERLDAFDRKDELTKLKEPRRDWEWPFPPQIINAGYQPDYNRVVFPAAILQPPFFDPKADPAVNFGAIAAIIGHEMGHGFDDEGSQSDGDGRLRDWWTDTARKQFEQRTAKLVEQYNGYSPVEGMHLNGQLTLGENIGDLGGLTIAYDAYRRFVDAEDGGQAPVLDGLTGDQRFFLAWAQVWHSIVTPDRARSLVLIDPHSPGRFRTNGVVRNMDAWYKAFDVKPGDALYLAPSDRVRIW